MQPIQQIVRVDNLLLDKDNPRFFHLSIQGKRELTQEDLRKEIEKEDETTTLLKAIKKVGVKDPIWVKEFEDGKFLVIEGNRRTVVLNMLMREGVKPPENVTYSEVLANVLPDTTSDAELVLQKARLQSGKKVWGPFNEAVLTHQLRYVHMLEPEDIAAELQIPIRTVNLRLENYVLFMKYAERTKDYNPKRFAFFTDAPKNVRDWFLESEENLEQYFKFITPTKGKQKIRSVATKGGLRDFAQVLDDRDAYDHLVSNEDATVEDAVEIAKENDVLKGMPFIRKLEPLATEMRGLSDTDIAKLKTEAKIKLQIKSLQKACDDLLKKME